MIYLLGQKWLWFVSIQNSLYDVPLSLVLIPFYLLLEAKKDRSQNPGVRTQNKVDKTSGCDSAPSLISNYFSVFEMPSSAVFQKFFTRFWQFKMLMKQAL
jgi:hypothetical protein